MDKVARPEPRKDELRHHEAEAYTVAEIQQIIDALNEEPLKWQAYLLLMIDTGVRRGEACGLQWQDVDFENNTVTISKNLCYTSKKGVYLDTPKNGKRRTIDVAPNVMDVLKLLQNKQAETVISPFVFAQEESQKPIHPQSPTKYMKRFAERCGIPDLHPHKLRHSFASIAITNGADIASVSEKMGHSDKGVTLRMYTHADAESMKRASNIFRDAIRKKE